MKCIIPLAGSDIYTEEFGLKPAYEIDGEPLLVKAICSRYWYGETLFEEDLIFVIRNIEQLDELISFLQSNFPKKRHVIIPEFTKGALMSVLAGAALVKDFTEPIVIDLVDILFSSSVRPVKTFNEDESIKGIIPYFHSDNPKYSYLKLDDDSNVVATREKEVISNYASAGVYFFNNLQTFLNAATFSINQFSKVAHNDLLYLCPSYNGIITKTNKVKAVKVDVQNEISLLF
jgi:dTDP-glucose pyrophosphorylase|tara:strand:- start:50 stop:745 length:696 start_codon:yes stop_codon:yes gene_type:complete